MRIGYASVNTQLPSAARTVRLANVTPQRLRELISANLNALESILLWNEEHGVPVFRLTSNLIPFGSHRVNDLNWEIEFAGRFGELGRVMTRSGARASTHPGQYTVLSSSEPLVAAAAIAELEYNAKLLSILGLDQSHKVVIHVGSGISDPAAATERFASGFGRLSKDARARLVIENDERWPIDKVLALARSIRVPVVFDAFHHSIAPPAHPLSVREAVLAAAATWRPQDGRPEVHFATQELGKRPGAHARTLDLDAFARFVDEVGDLPLDCILEVKDKERSVLRAQQAGLA